jgi:signal peptidase I
MFRDNKRKYYRKKNKEFLSGFFEWIITFVITIVISLLIVGNIGSITLVKGRSMEPTLWDNNRVMNYKLEYNFKEPKRGEIVIVDKDNDKKGIMINAINEGKSIINNIMQRLNKVEEDRVKFIVKRIIGIPGDIIDIQDGLLYINDELQEEDYIKGQTFESSNFSYPIEIQDNQVFVLGDNRENSSDSRDLGPIEYNQIIGRVKFRLWPMGKI